MGLIAAGAAAATPLALLIVGGVAVIALKRRRTARRRNARTPSLRVAGAWHEVVDRYEELGARPRPNATTTEFARGLQAAELIDDNDGDLLLALANDADEAAYHPAPADGQHADGAWERSDRLVMQLGARQGIFTKLRHRMNPRPLFRKDPLMADEDRDD